MQIVRSPEPDVARQFLSDELLSLAEERGRFVQVIAECMVQYQGRARSMLHRGQRVLLLKPDGTFLVHAATKAKPVNWQPPGASFNVGIEDGQVVLTAYRAKPEEIVKVIFYEISLLLSSPLEDREQLDLVGSEDDLQALLFATPELVEPGFVPRRRERDSKRGFYDIDGDDADGRRVVIEIKRATAGIKEAQQLWRYVDPLRQQNPDGKLRGMLIAPRVADKARAFLRDHDMEWKELDWETILPQVERMRRTGQVGLGKFN